MCRSPEYGTVSTPSFAPLLPLRLDESTSIWRWLESSLDCLLEIQLQWRLSIKIHSRLVFAVVLTRLRHQAPRNDNSLGHQRMSVTFQERGMNYFLGDFRNQLPELFLFNRSEEDRKMFSKVKAICLIGKKYGSVLFLRVSKDEEKRANISHCSPYLIFIHIIWMCLFFF